MTDLAEWSFLAVNGCQQSEVDRLTADEETMAKVFGKGFNFRTIQHEHIVCS